MYKYFFIIFRIYSI